MSNVPDGEIWSRGESLQTTSKTILSPQFTLDQIYFKSDSSGQQARCKWGLDRCRNNVLEKVRNMISWQEKYCSRAFPAKESDRCRSRTGGGDRPLPPSLPPSVPRHETLFGAGQQNLQLDGASICFKKRKMHLPSFILIFQQQLTCKNVFNIHN